PGYNLPPLSQGGYLHPDLVQERDRLLVEISLVRPNIILALGATAAWALLGTSKISQIRGTVADSPFGKVLATFHPAYVLRSWETRPIVIADLIKAKAESEFPEIRRIERNVHTNPTLEEVLSYEHTLLSARLLAVDTETKG